MPKPKRKIETDSLDLPAVPVATLAQNNLVYRKRAALHLASTHGEVKLTIAPPNHEQTGPFARLEGTCSGGAFSLFLPHALLDRMLGHAFPDLDKTRLEPDELALALMASDAPLLEALAKASEGPLDLAGVTLNTEAEEGFDITCTVEGVSYDIRMALPAPETKRFYNALITSPLAPTKIEGLSATIAFRCGYTLISVIDLSNLEIGSGIMLDGTTLGFQKITAVLSERFVQSCTWQTIKPVLDGVLLNRADSLTKFYTSGAHVLDESYEASTVTVGEVPVHLVFELGRMEIPVSELETLNTGYVFELGRPLSQSVEILANGKRIGSGELVRLGESIGVRVTRLVA